jgi:hypothetical protein
MLSSPPAAVHFLPVISTFPVLESGIQSALSNGQTESSSAPDTISPDQVLIDPGIIDFGWLICRPAPACGLPVGPVNSFCGIRKIIPE